MPEGDTIFRSARTLHRALAGKTITRFETAYAQLSVVDDQSAIVGRRVEQVESRGKHLLMWLSGDLVLRTHMRMSGSWHIYRPGERWQLASSHMRILIATADFVAVAFDVPDAEFLSPAALKRSRAIAALGPDLLDDAFDVEAAVARLRAQATREIGVALLDQRVMAGIGNIFKSEILFVSGVHPFAHVERLDDETLRNIVTTARRLLQANVTPTSGAGITTFGGMRRTTGDVDPAARVWVSQRRGLPCRRCGAPIERRLQGEDARATYWCPACQPQTA